MEKKRQQTETKYWWRKDNEPKRVCAIRYQPGQPCPKCTRGRLAYNGLFILACPVCGYVAEGGAFT